MQVADTLCSMGACPQEILDWRPKNGGWWRNWSKILFQHQLLNPADVGAPQRPQSHLMLIVEENSIFVGWRDKPTEDQVLMFLLILFKIWACTTLDACRAGGARVQATLLWAHHCHGEIISNQVKSILSPLFIKYPCWRKQINEWVSWVVEILPGIDSIMYIERYCVWHWKDILWSRTKQVVVPKCHNIIKKYFYKALQFYTREVICELWRQD